jgi:hypothetical protein
MRSVRVTVAVGLALIGVALVLVLSSSPLTVTATNSIPAKVDVEFVRGNVVSCQVARVLPRGISAIRIAVEARAVGPMISVKVFSGSHVLTEGHQAAGWGSAPTVTVPIGRLGHALYGARVCTTFGSSVEPFRLCGEQLGSNTAASGTLGGLTLRMEYLKPAHDSWSSLASSIFHRIGMGREPGGTWIAYLALLLLIAAAAIASHLLLRELR